MAQAAQKIETLTYIPSPSMSEFHHSDAFVRGVLGPVGSGKTVGMCIEIYFRALEMPPSVRDGVRKSRWAIVRNTYAELKSTTIKSWEDWMPMAQVVYDTPIRWRWRGPIGDGTRIDLEVFFVAMDIPKHVKKLKGMELTGVWLNEAVELPKAAIDIATQRVARYPRNIDVPKIKENNGHERPGFWNGVIMDTNACDDDHWWYSWAEEDTPKGYKFWRQPPALLWLDGEWTPNRGQIPGIPAAENVEHQPKGFDYWTELAQGKQHEWIRVFCGAEYGTYAEGRPVHPEYQDSLHCTSAEPLNAYENVAITLGWDFGLTPACAICQVTRQEESSE